MAEKDKFREALRNVERVDLIVEQLGHADLTVLLVKFGGLEQFEADELKALHRDSRVQLRAIISKIVEKDSANAYIGLSKVIQYKSSYIWQKVFPFTPEHNKLQVKKNPGQNATAPSSPHILWLCCSRELFDAAREIAGHANMQLKNTPRETFQYCELPPVLDGADVPVWLFYPVDNSYESVLPKLLAYYNRTNYFLFTGSAAPVSRPRVQDSDICVVKPREPVFRPLVEELCHMTVLWDMNTEMKKPWQCSKVVFGSVGGGGGDVSSTGAASFCRASEQLLKSGRTVPNAAILAVTQDHSKCYECGEPHIYHSVYYTYHVIKYLCEKKLLLDCFDH